MWLLLVFEVANLDNISKLSESDREERFIMNIKNTMKMFGLGVVVVAVAVGCASAKKGGPGLGIMAAPAAAAGGGGDKKMAKASGSGSGSGDVHVVQKGECLWCISKLDKIYGNPFQWPLIYAANADQIKDADLIYPGQKLTIRRGVPNVQINAAIKHAKTRGAWSLGPQEATDRKYLSM